MGSPRAVVLAVLRYTGYALLVCMTAVACFAAGWVSLYLVGAICLYQWIMGVIITDKWWPFARNG